MAEETSTAQVAVKDTAPAQLKSVSFKPSAAPTPVPEHVEKMDFKDDFEVEQLPEQGSTEETGKKTEEKVEKKVETPKKEEANTEEEVTPTEEETSTEEEAPKLPKGLKPPKGTDMGKEKPAVKPIVPAGKVARDYTGYTPEQVTALRGMSNEGYKLATELIKQTKELAKSKDSLVYQHPQAYVLDPGFQKVRSDLTFAQKEAGYWEQQLVNMDAGKELVPITGFDVKGNPILGNPIPPTKALEEKVRMMIHNCYNAAQNFQGELSKYPTKYQETVQKDIAGLEDFRKQQFGWVADPKLLDYTVEVAGLGERSLKQVREDVKAMVPPWMQSHPLVPVLGDVVIALRLLQAEKAELEGMKKVDKTKEEEQEFIEPSSKNKPSGGSKGDFVHGLKEFKTDPSLGI